MSCPFIRSVSANYQVLGQHWPDSRYRVISLYFDIQGQDKPTLRIEDWRCVYDLKAATFSVPADFTDNNAKTAKTPSADRQ